MAKQLLGDAATALRVRQRENGGVGIREIAERLKVSISTVSRALNGDDGVGKVRAASIRALADELGYRPQPIRRRRTRAIGLVISTTFRQDGPDPNERYFQQLGWWMERLVAQHRLHLNLHFVNRNEVSPAVPLIIQENRVDGIIMAGHPSAEFCALAREMSVPAVAISDTVERTGLDCVMIDESDAVRQLVRQLTAMGHRDVAWISTERRFPVIAAAEDVFVEAMRDAGIEVPPHRIVRDFSPNLAGGRRASGSLLGGPSIPTAMVFANDWMAVGGMAQLQRRGYEIPSQISIVGRGNESICEEIDPRLTTIDRRVGDILAAALETLLERIETDGGQPQQRFLPARVIWRDSCAPASQK